MEKGCAVCEIQTKILYTVRTNVPLQGVCHGSGAEGRFRVRSGQVGWWAHCHWDGFSPVRFSPPLPFHPRSTFSFLSKVACQQDQLAKPTIAMLFRKSTNALKKSIFVLECSKGKSRDFILDHVVMDE